MSLSAAFPLQAVACFHRRRSIPTCCMVLYDFWQLLIAFPMSHGEHLKRAFPSREPRLLQQIIIHQRRVGRAHCHDPTVTKSSKSQPHAQLVCVQQGFMSYNCFSGTAGVSNGGSSPTIKHVPHLFDLLGGCSSITFSWNATEDWCFQWNSSLLLAFQTTY